MGPRLISLLTDRHRFVLCKPRPWTHSNLSFEPAGAVRIRMAVISPCTSPFHETRLRRVTLAPPLPFQRLTTFQQAEESHFRVQVRAPAWGWVTYAFSPHRG